VRLRKEQGLIFVIVALEADYTRPARLDDELTVTCEIEAHARASFVFRQKIYRHKDCPMDGRKDGGMGDGELLVSGRTRVACLDADSMKPKAFPSVLVKELEQ
jgi:acyl-CoA thioester hydrolase